MFSVGRRRPAAVDVLPGPRSRTDPLISPLYGNWTGLPPLYFLAGSTEMLLDDSVRAHDRAQQARHELAHRRLAGHAARVPAVLDVAGGQAGARRHRLPSSSSTCRAVRRLATREMRWPPALPLWRRTSRCRCRRPAPRSSQPSARAGTLPPHRARDWRRRARPRSPGTRASGADIPAVRPARLRRQAPQCRRRESDSSSSSCPTCTSVGGNPRRSPWIGEANGSPLSRPPRYRRAHSAVHAPRHHDFTGGATPRSGLPRSTQGENSTSAAGNGSPSSRKRSAVASASPPPAESPMIAMRCGRAAVTQQRAIGRDGIVDAPPETDVRARAGSPRRTRGPPCGARGGW